MSELPKYLNEQALRDALGEIASGAYLDFDRDNYPRLYRDVKQPDGTIFEELLHYGWLEPKQPGRGYQLSMAGHRAYMRASDEMQGKLERPFATRNHNPGSPHPESLAPPTNGEVSEPDSKESE